jgi:4-hydroxybenzoate polyprenyltransferase
MAIAIFFVGTIGLLAGLGIVTHLHWAFWVSLAMATVGWFWQITNLIKPELPNPIYGQMFRQNVWIGLILLTGMIVGNF